MSVALSVEEHASDDPFVAKRDEVKALGFEREENGFPPEAEGLAQELDAQIDLRSVVRVVGVDAENSQG